MQQSTKLIFALTIIAIGSAALIWHSFHAPIVQPAPAAPEASAPTSTESKATSTQQAEAPAPKPEAKKPAPKKEPLPPASVGIGTGTSTGVGTGTSTGTGQAATTTPEIIATSTPKVIPATAQAAELYDLTNADRKANGIPALEYNAKLERSAQAKADDMAKYGYFSHTNHDLVTDPATGTATSTGFTFWPKQAGYIYASFAENLAVGYATIKDAEAAFMASPEHRPNILNETHVYTEVGIGIAAGTYEGRPVTFVAVHFGRQPGQ